MAPSHLRGGRGRRVLSGLVAVALLAGAACSGDDGGASSTTTTTVDDATTTTVGGSTTSPTTTAPGSGLPLNDSGLVDALIDPAEVAEGLADDGSGSEGAFSTTLCPDVDLEATWDDQASQGLLRREGGILAFTQSILAFGAPEEAEAFLDAFAEGITTCDPGVGVSDVEDVADRAVRLAPSAAGGPTAAGALLRVGDRMSYLLVVGDPEAGVEDVLSDDLLSEAAARMAS